MPVKRELWKKEKAKTLKMRVMKLVPLPCPTYIYIPHGHKIRACSSSTQKSRRAFSLSALTLSLSALVCSNGNGPTTSISWANPQVPKFLELPNSGGVKSLDLRIGDGETPLDGDVVPFFFFFFFSLIFVQS